MKVHRIDHVSIVVNDIPAAKAFFLGLGFELQGKDRWKGPGWIG
jgi:catechol 2,3-dioxygenase-like lactoylglutathione lyase family enzyme